MSKFVQISSKYLAGKKKEVVLWNESNGTIKIQTIDTIKDEVIKEDIKTVK